MSTNGGYARGRGTDNQGACSLKLIRGTLDQVDEKAHITWVQPRVLSRGQIGELAGRLDVWIERLGRVEQRIAPQVSGTA